MRMYDYLLDNYGYNYPILLEELNIPNMSNSSIRMRLSRLNASGKVIKHSQGVYYIPKNTILGASKISTEEVLNKKYVNSKNNYYGFYSGLSFYNLIGISTQIPFVYEIVTNKEKSRCRRIKINNQRVILRKPYLTITENNYLELQFLDFIKNISIADIKDNYELIKKYIILKDIKSKVISDLIKFYPSKTSKKLLESGLINEFI